MDVSIIKEVPKICKDQEFKFERFHCGGNGGQNVMRRIIVPTYGRFTAD